MMVGDLVVRSRIRTIFRSWPDIIAQATWASAMIRAGRGPLAGRVAGCAGLVRHFRVLI